MRIESGFKIHKGCPVLPVFWLNPYFPGLSFWDVSGVLCCKRSTKIAITLKPDH